MIALRAYKSELLLWRTRSTLPAHPLPSTRIISKSDTCTLRETRSLARLEDFERFLRSRPSRKGLSGESSSVAEAEADVVSVPLTRLEVSEGVYTRERRAALSGSADCERGIREGYSGANGVDSGGSTTWSRGGEAVGEDGEGGVVGCATEPLSEASISITDLAEAEVDDAVSSSIGEGTPSESSSEGDGPVFCVKLSFRDS